MNKLIVCCTYAQHEAPSKPLNVKTSSVQSSSVEVRWEPPDTTNGNIAKYVIHWEEISQSNPEKKTEEVHGQHNDVKMVNLTQLTRYLFWIVAVNVRETDRKELEGPPSQIATFITAGGRKCKIDVRGT